VPHLRRRAVKKTMGKTTRFTSRGRTRQGAAGRLAFWTATAGRLAGGMNADSSLGLYHGQRLPPCAGEIKRAGQPWTDTRCPWPPRFWDVQPRVAQVSHSASALPTMVSCVERLRLSGVSPYFHSSAEAAPHAARRNLAGQNSKRGGGAGSERWSLSVQQAPSPAVAARGA
jgi:hypothetical protein